MAERWTLDSWRNRPAAQMPIYPEWQSRTPGGHSRHRTPAWNSVTSTHSLWLTRATTLRLSSWMRSVRLNRIALWQKGDHERVATKRNSPPERAGHRYQKSEI
jgi:hypothetical protein